MHVQARTPLALIIVVAMLFTAVLAAPGAWAAPEQSSAVLLSSSTPTEGATGTMRVEWTDPDPTVTEWLVIVSLPGIGSGGERLEVEPDVALCFGPPYDTASQDSAQETARSGCGRCEGYRDRCVDSGERCLAGCRVDIPVPYLQDSNGDEVTFEVTIDTEAGTHVVADPPSVTVANAPPVATLGPPYLRYECCVVTEVPEASTVQVRIAAEDPGGTFYDGDLASWELDWGDGTIDSGTEQRHTYGAFKHHTYTDDLPGDDALEIRFTVWDDDGASHTATQDLLVTNVEPEVVIDEASHLDGLASLTFTFDDVSADTHTAEVDWGDGTVEPVDVHDGAGTYTVTQPVASPAVDQFVTVAVTDDDGGRGTDVVVLDGRGEAPSITAASLSTDEVREGGTATLTVGWADPGQEEHELSVDWGDGVTEIITPELGSRAETLTHIYLDDDPSGGEHQLLDITVGVRDIDGEDSTTVPLTVLNDAPWIFEPEVVIDEGGHGYTLDVSFVDAGPVDTHSVVIVWGDGATDEFDLELGARSFSRSHTYADRPGGFGTVTVTDDDSAERSEHFALNTDPVAHLAPAGPILEGEEVTFDASGSTDADGDELHFNWDLDDNGTYETSTGTSPYLGPLTFENSGTYPIGVNVSDWRTGTHQASTVLTVENAAPVAEAGGPYAGTLGEPITLDASDSADPSPLDEISFAWDLDGDGLFGSDDTDGVFGVEGSAEPTEPVTTFDAPSAGTFTVAVRVADQEGATSEDTADVTVIDTGGGTGGSTSEGTTGETSGGSTGVTTSDGTSGTTGETSGGTTGETTDGSGSDGSGSDGTTGETSGGSTATASDGTTGETSGGATGETTSDGTSGTTGETSGGATGETDGTASDGTTGETSGGATGETTTDGTTGETSGGTSDGTASGGTDGETSGGTSDGTASGGTSGGTSDGTASGGTTGETSGGTSDGTASGGTDSGTAGGVTGDTSGGTTGETTGDTSGGTTGETTGDTSGETTGDTSGGATGDTAGGTSDGTGTGSPDDGEPDEQGPPEPTPAASDRHAGGPGTTRIETAVAVSQESYPANGSVDAVVLARADVPADALAGTTLAASRNAPLLLSYTSSLHQATEEEIQRVLRSSGTVYLLGGPNALGTPVAERLASHGFEVRRLHGPTRFETAVAIAEATTSTPTEVFLATAWSFQDALVAGPAAASVGGVVVLTDGSRAHSATSAYLGEVGAPAVAIGSAAATAYPEAPSHVGATDPHTSAIVASAYFADASEIGVARVDVFADALSGGVHIAMRGGGMVLTDRDTLDTDVEAHLVEHRIELDIAHVYGGPNAISEPVREEVRTAIA